MLRVLAYSLILININNVRAEFSFSGGDWKIYRDIGVNGCMDDVHSSYTLNLTVSDSTINGNYNNLPSNDSIFTGKLYSSSSTEGLVLDLLQSGHRPDGSNYNATQTGVFISNDEVVGTWYSVGGDGGDFLLVKSGVTPTTSLHEECDFSSQIDIDNTIEQGKQICIDNPSDCGINTTTELELPERDKVSLTLAPLVIGADIKFDSNNDLGVRVELASYSDPVDAIIDVDLFNASKQLINSHTYTGSQIVAETQGFEGGGNFTIDDGSKINQYKLIIEDKISDLNSNEISYARVFFKNKSACKTFGEESTVCTKYSSALIANTNNLGDSNSLDAGETRFINIDDNSIEDASDDINIESFSINLSRMSSASTSSYIGNIYTTINEYIIVIKGMSLSSTVSAREATFKLTPSFLPDPSIGEKGSYYATIDGSIIYADILGN